MLYCDYCSDDNFCNRVKEEGVIMILPLLSLQRVSEELNIDVIDLKHACKYGHIPHINLSKNKINDIRVIKFSQDQLNDVENYFNNKKIFKESISNKTCNTNIIKFNVSTYEKLKYLFIKHEFLLHKTTNIKSENNYQGNISKITKSKINRFTLLNDYKFDKYGGKALIYFIVNENETRIKIGHTRSNSYENRLYSLQTGSPDVLTCIFCLYAYRDFEKYLHDKFKKYSHHNEWFIFSDEIKSFIIELKKLLGDNT